MRGHVQAPVPNGLSEFEQGGANWFDGVSPLDSARVYQHVTVASRGETAPACEYRMVTASAAVVWVRHWWAVARGTSAIRHGGRVEGFVQIIDQRKALEAECIRIGERERFRLGEELHDDVCQLMAGLACMLELLGRQVKQVSPHLSSSVNELVSEVQGGLVRTRSLAHGLVPFGLVALGLPAALAELARRTTTCRRVEVVTHFGPNLPVIRPELILHLYRIAQESIGNAVKHGGAGKIVLRLGRRGPGLSMTIRDNGTGISAKPHPYRGVGLDIMRHRAFEIGADLVISSWPRGGTLVTVRLAGSAAKPAVGEINL